MKKKLLFTIFLLTCGICHAQTITISNGAGSSWTISPLASTITKAGKNYEHIEVTQASHTLLTVNSLLLWTVSVQQVAGSNWDPALKVSVRRSGDGGGSAILGGNYNYILLTNMNQAIVSGLLGLVFSRTNMPFQYKVEGLSVIIPAKTYTTTILYTIVGL